MTTTTPKYALPYPDPNDPVANGDDTVKALAQRADLVLGESGSVGITIVANGTTGVPLVFSRNYGALALVVTMTLRGAPSGFTWATPFVTGQSGAGFTANVRGAVAGLYTFDWTVRAAL